MSPAAVNFEEVRGPDAPAIENEFDQFDTVNFQTRTVTFDPNGGGGAIGSVTTDIGTITLPSPADLGFSAPEGALFVGWSTDASGRTNVYSQDVTFPDNASHTAALDRDTTLYAIWLDKAVADSGTTAYFYIRAEGTIPFEPAQGAQSAYVPGGSATTLQGTLRQPVAVTNNPAAIERNLLVTPSNDLLESVLGSSGIAFNPDQQKVVWYVIKSRQYGGGTWNVDGIVVQKSAYVVYYNPNGGYSDVPAARSHIEGSSVAVDFSIVPTRPGYDFLGWADNPTATTPDYPASQAAAFTMPAANKQLYAIWAPRFVDFTYDADPTAGGTVTVAANSVRSCDGQGITGSSAQTAPGHIFIGWYQGDRLITENPDLDAFAAAQAANRLSGAFVATAFTARFAQAHPAMKVSKEVLNAPANGEYFAQDEMVEYRVTVTNAGNVALLSLAMNDTLCGSRAMGALAPGDAAHVEYRCQVTADDARRGFMINEVSVKGSAFDGRGNALAVPEQVAGAAVRTGVLPAEDTYVLYGAYPADGGSVGQNYAIVNAATAEGLSDRTAVPQKGYRFAGWYEGDALVSQDATLTADQMRHALNHDPDTRSNFAPTLFIAHFVPADDQPETPDQPNPPVTPVTPQDPTNPDAPEQPSNPDSPTTPDKPTPPKTPSASEKPSKPAALPSDGGTSRPATADSAKESASNPAGTAHRSTPTPAAAKAVPEPSPATGDATARTAIAIGAIAATAALAAALARRRPKNP